MLSRRDAWLLPLISACTLLLMLGAAEIGARLFWPEQEVNACKVRDDALGFRYRPHCTSTMKAAEGPWYTNRYNERGYRSNASCGPVAAGARRIAIVGSSIAEGYLVEYPHTIGAVVAGDLAAMCGSPVEVQNLGAKGYTGRLLLSRMAEALALHPQAVLFIQTPFDVELQLDDETLPLTGDATPHPRAHTRSPDRLDRVRNHLSGFLKESRAVTVAQHFMFRDPSFYLPLFLDYGDKAAFLRPPFTRPWRERLRRFDLLVAALADQAHRAGVPFTLVFVPHQAQIALEAGAATSARVDPEALPTALEAIAVRRGATFIDSSEALRKQRDPARLFYRVDGHPSGEGQPIIGHYVAQRLINLDPTAFVGCRDMVTPAQPPAVDLPQP